MAELSPAALANLDQSVARVDEGVDRYTRQIGALIAAHGKEAAVATFNAWLQRQPADAVAALATGALARLATTPPADPTPTPTRG